MDDDHPNDAHVILVCIALLLLIAIVELMPVLVGVTP